MSNDPRREDDGDDEESMVNSIPPWHADQTGARRIAVEQKLKPLPQIPKGEEANPFFTFVQDHNEVQRLDRIALFLDNEDKAAAEEIRRKGYMRREAERDARDEERERRQEERDAAQALWAAQLAEEFKRAVRTMDRLEQRVAGLETSVRDVKDETRKNTIQLSRVSGCVGKLETNVEIISKAQKAFGLQLAQIHGETSQIADRFEVAMSNEEGRRHDVEHQVAELRNRFDELVKRVATLESMLRAEFAYRKEHGYGPAAAPEEEAGADHGASDEGGPSSER